MRQITAAIRLRQETHLRYDAHLLEWQTRHLVRAIVSAVPIEKGKKNPLIPLIEEVKLSDAVEPAQHVEIASKSWTPEDEPLALRRARQGSAGEAMRFMSVFGPGAQKRWRG